MKKLLIAIILVLATLALAACGSPKPGNISGVIAWETVGAGNVAVVGVTVYVGDDESKIASGVSDGSGRYTITDIPPGFYFVAAHQDASGYLIAEKSWILENIEVKSNKTTQLDLTYDNAWDGTFLPK